MHPSASRIDDNVNPYQSPGETLGAPPLSAIYVAPITFPADTADCASFTYGEFANLFEQKLHQACRPMGVKTIQAGDASNRDDQTTTITGSIISLTDYHLTSWNKLKKWVLPFIGYRYRPASFEIVGQIESLHHETIPFRLTRKIKRGRLGEKRNMLIALDSEAARVISLAIGPRSGQSSEQNTRPFWTTLCCVPLFVALALSFSVYSFQDSDTVTRWIRTTLTFIAAALISISALPPWLYRDRRASFFYRITAAKRSLELRAFPLIIGLVVAALLAASFIYGDG